MLKVNKYQNIDEVEREAKKDYIDRHSPFIYCLDHADKGKKFPVKIVVGNEYSHPDDFDHYIASVSLYDGQTLVAKADFFAGATLGGEKGQVEVDFNIIPKKNMKLTAQAYCTKHGIWESDTFNVEVN